MFRLCYCVPFDIDIRQNRARGLVSYRDCGSGPDVTVWACCFGHGVEPFLGPWG